MSSFGEELRKQREARNISLQEISDRTRIGVRQLKAIENEQLDQLPGGIFNRSFVRQYARHLGLDEDRIVAEYLEAAGGIPEPPVAPSRDLYEENSALPDAGYPRLIFTAVCLGMAVAALLYVVHQISERRAAKASRATVSAASGTSGATGDMQDASPLAAAGNVNPIEAIPSPPPASTALPPATSAPVSGIAVPAATVQHLPPGTADDNHPNPPAGIATASAKLPDQAAGADPGTEGLLLQIDARKEVWLSITTDGKKEWQGTLLQDGSRRVQARESVKLTVGDAGAVALTLNGKSLPSVGRTGEVKNLAISAKGLAESAP